MHIKWNFDIRYIVFGVCRIYVDAIINHMAADGEGFGSGGSYWDGTNQEFPGT